VAIARPAPLRAAMLDLALLGDHDERVAAAIAALADSLVLHRLGPETIVRSGLVDPQQDGDAVDTVVPLGHQRHLVAVGIGQRLWRSEAIPRDQQPDDP